MYNYWHGCSENGEKESLASNQVVGGSNFSWCAKYFKHLAHFRTFESSQKMSVRASHPVKTAYRLGRLSSTQNNGAG